MSAEAEPLLVDSLPEMTEAEYLALDAASEDSYEYRDGKVYMMAVGSPNHSAISASVISYLDNTLGDDSACTVHTSDLKIHVATSYRHPDLSVVCSELEYVEGRTDVITNPILLVEVISPSSVVIDYNEKLGEYTSIASLRDYLLISQDKPTVEHYTRQDDDQWLYQNITGLESTVYLPSLDCTLALSRIYRRVV